MSITETIATFDDWRRLAASGDGSAVDLAYHRLAAAADPALCLAMRPPAEARELARAAASTDPLAGIPFVVKDNIDVAGLPTTAGCPAYAYQPAESAPAVARLEAAGAVCIAKTNLDQFATGLVGTRSPHGTPRNPLAPDHVPGGSSAGSGAAVAGGCVPFALGTDTAGSGRVPAAFGRIVGLKPSRGLVSSRGVVPAVRSLDCVSIFATSAGACAELLAVVGHYDREDPFARLIAPSVGTVRRIGVPDPAALDLDPEARPGFAAAIAAAGDNAEVVTIDPAPLLEAARLLYDGPWVAERTAAVGAFITEHRTDCDPTVAGIIAGGEAASAVEAFRASYRLADLRRWLDELWTTCDAILLPTTPTIPTLAAVAAEPVAVNSRLGTYTNFCNLLDCAAVAVPCPDRSDGLPAGVTLCGPAGSDRALLALGDHLHRRADVGLGASAVTSAKLPPFAPPVVAPGELALAVCGAHLAGEPLHPQLLGLGARLLAATTTAARYRLLHLADTEPAKPALVPAAEGGHAIGLEVYAVPSHRIGELLASIPAPLALGSIELDDGSTVHGFVGDAGAKGTDISAHGDWRRYRAAQG